MNCSMCQYNKVQVNKYTKTDRQLDKRNSEHCLYTIYGRQKKVILIISEYWSNFTVIYFQYKSLNIVTLLFDKK